MDVDYYLKNSYKVSELITKEYSTSFSLATSLMEKEKRKAIYAIYGFVRLADEVVDSFHGYDQLFLFNNLEEQLHYAFQHGISTNTILASFVDTVHRYHISHEHVRAFMDSMRLDLTQTDYTSNEELSHYIYGSADVVGLMCLRVFCDGDEPLSQQLEYSAQKLGSAFQKVNFLRDLNSDKEGLGRSYFPEVCNNTFDEQSKRAIENSIERDFDDALPGIRRLPGRSKLSVLLAYYYYRSLLNKIKKSTPECLLSKRLRIHDGVKYQILAKVLIQYKLKRI